MPQRPLCWESPVRPGMEECVAELLTGCLPPLQLPIPRVTSRLSAQEHSLWKVSQWRFLRALPHPKIPLSSGAPVPSQLSPWQAHWPCADAPSNLFPSALDLSPPGILLLLPPSWLPQPGSPILISVSLLSASDLSGTLSPGLPFQASSQTLLLR